jgi:hypothetical protein
MISGVNGTADPYVPTAIGLHVRMGMAVFRGNPIMFHQYSVKKGHARTFSSELIHILLLKISTVSNISRNSSLYLILHLNALAEFAPKSTGGNFTNYFMKYY